MVEVNTALLFAYNGGLQREMILLRKIDDVHMAGVYLAADAVWYARD